MKIRTPGLKTPRRVTRVDFDMKSKAVNVHFPKVNLEDLLPQDPEYRFSIMKQEDLESCTKLIAYCFVRGEPITVL